jgi:four helix bundle protein
MGTHKELAIWQEGIDLVQKVYNLAQGFPKEELYGLSSQIKRCAVSIPSNIAEGAARNSENEYIRFLHISLGSLSELETQMEIAKRLKFISDFKVLEDIEILRKKMLNFIKYLKSKRGQGKEFSQTLEPMNSLSHDQVNS